MPRYDVFLSHASADKPAVERLARKLKEAGVKPFLDKWELVAGKLWQEELEKAVRDSGCCAVFFGPVSKGGAWRNQESQLALKRSAAEPSFLVIPILLPGAKEEDVSDLLSLRTWVDFRKSIDDPDAFAHLVASIRTGPSSPEPQRSSVDYRCMAPAREPFVHRSEYTKVRDALLLDGITTVGITTAIHGAGGFGKTALAVELCYDPVVRARYPDGVLWVQMRDNLNDEARLKEVRDVLRRWTDQEPPAFETFAKVGQHLVEQLRSKRVLLVVDDAWQSGDVAPFQGLSSAAALLITTRDRRTLPRESVSIPVDAMEIPEAVQLLGARLSAGKEEALKTFAARLGEWPLLLKLVNRQVDGWIGQGLNLGEAIQRAEKALAAKGLTFFDPKDATERSQAAALTLEVSLERLSQEDQERFAQLAIFPEDVNVPSPVLEKLWQLDSFDVEELSSRLYALSLLRDLDLSAGTIRLHDVIRAYLLKKGESHLAEWHLHLLDTYRPANGHWPDLLRAETYIWNYLFHHLIGAEQSDLCRDLLLSFQYLDAKLKATGINGLLADYSSFVAEDQELRLVRDALWLSAHVLARNPEEIPGQLLGRLLDRSEAGIRRLLQGSKGLAIPALRPRKASFTRPGGALVRTIEHPGRPQALAVLPDGRVVSGSSDGTLRVWDVESGQNLKTLGGHSEAVCAVAVLGSRWVISGSDDGTLRVWDVESGQNLKTLEGHSEAVRAVAVLGSRWVISGSDDGTSRVWDVESGQILQTLGGSSEWVRALSVLDSGRVVSGFDYGTLRVWDAKSGQILKTFGGHSDRVGAISVLNSGRIVSGSDDGTLRVWDIEREQIIQTLEGHSDRVRTVAALGSRRVVSGSDDRTLRVWDVDSGQSLQTLVGHSSWVRSIAVLNSRRVVSGSADETLRVWDVEGGQTLQALEGHSSWVRAMAALSSRQVVSGSSDGTLRVWDVESGRTLQTLVGHSSWVRALAVLDSRYVVSGSSDETLRVWDIESGQTLHTLVGHSSWVRAVGVLDNRHVVSGSSDRTLRVWDVESGQILRVLEGHSRGVLAVAVLDSRRVVSSSSDGTLRVWDVRSGETLQTFVGHSWVRTVSVLDNRRLLLGSSDGRLRVWDVESGQTLQTFGEQPNWVRAVAVLNSRRVVSGSPDGTLRVWDLENEKVECIFTLDAPVTAVTLIPDRCIVVAGDASGHVHFFDFITQ